METQKTFKSSEVYGIAMRGAHIQPALASLNSEMQELDAEVNNLYLKIRRLQERRRILEFLRNAIWNAKSESELASLEQMEKNPVVLSEDPDYPESLRYSEDDVEEYHYQDEEQ